CVRRTGVCGSTAGICGAPAPCALPPRSGVSPPVRAPCAGLLRRTQGPPQAQETLEAQPQGPSSSPPQALTGRRIDINEKGRLYAALLASHRAVSPDAAGGANRFTGTRRVFPAERRPARNRACAADCWAPATNRYADVGANSGSPLKRTPLLPSNTCRPSCS